MPAKSLAELKLMRAVEHGWKKPGGGGPSKKVATEFVEATKSTRNLPEKVGKKSK